MNNHNPTQPDRPNTFLMGSGIGGLASVCAMCGCPHIFSGASCLSVQSLMGESALGEGLTAILRSRGCPPDVDWMTLKFHGAGYSESTWRSRVHIPLEILLGTEY